MCQFIFKNRSCWFSVHWLDKTCQLLETWWVRAFVENSGRLLTTCSFCSTGSSMKRAPRGGGRCPCWWHEQLKTNHAPDGVTCKITKRDLLMTRKRVVWIIPFPQYNLWRKPSWDEEQYQSLGNTWKLVLTWTVRILSIQVLFLDMVKPLLKFWGMHTLRLLLLLCTYIYTHNPIWRCALQD